MSTLIQVVAATTTVMIRGVFPSIDWPDPFTNRHCIGILDDLMEPDHVASRTIATLPISCSVDYKDRERMMATDGVGF
jgi:hypothetical protein